MSLQNESSVAGKELQIQIGIQYSTSLETSSLGNQSIKREILH